MLVVAVVGVGPEYGAHLLLEGFARLASDHPGIGLLLCGPGARDMRLDSAIGRLGLRAAVHRLGDLSRGEALGAIAAADLFVRPTLTDGDSVSVREALALGRRVVASDASPRPPGVRCFVSGDPGAFARACAEALAAACPVGEPRGGLDVVLDLYASLGLPLPPAARDGRSMDQPAPADAPMAVPDAANASARVAALGAEAG